MSSYVNLLFQSDYRFLRPFSSNLFCNSCAWMLLGWFLVHLVFDKGLDVFFVRLRFKEFIRQRLIGSLWWLGFFASALFFGGIIWRQNLNEELFEFRKLQAKGDSLPLQHLTYCMLLGFFLQNAFWDGLKNNDGYLNVLGHVLFSGCIVLSYILRIMDIILILTALQALPKVLFEFTKLTSLLSGSNESKILKTFYSLSIISYIATYFFVIPSSFLFPLGKFLYYDFSKPVVILLFVVTLLWYSLDLYNSILLKALKHSFTHNEETKHPICTGDLYECSLFNPRDDAAFNLFILRQEIKAREAKVMSMRKPKNRGVLFQTLKCMVALKRKQKRISANQANDEEENVILDEEVKVETEEETVETKDKDV